MLGFQNTLTKIDKNSRHENPSLHNLNQMICSNILMNWCTCWSYLISRSIETVVYICLQYVPLQAMLESTSESREKKTMGGKSTKMNIMRRPRIAVVEKKQKKSYNKKKRIKFDWEEKTIGLNWYHKWWGREIEGEINEQQSRYAKRKLFFWQQ